MNVIGSRPDGWWRDRDGALRRLVGRLQALAEAEQCAVTVVADGRPLAGLAEGEHAGVQVLYGRGAARNAADDRIVEVVEADAAPATLEVVTSDRALAGRVRALGVSVRGASTLLAQLDALDR